MTIIKEAFLTVLMTTSFITFQSQYSRYRDFHNNIAYRLWKISDWKKWIKIDSKSTLPTCITYLTMNVGVTSNVINFWFAYSFDKVQNTYVFHWQGILCQYVLHKNISCTDSQYLSLLTVQATRQKRVCFI